MPVQLPGATRGGVWIDVTHHRQFFPVPPLVMAPRRILRTLRTVHLVQPLSRGILRSPPISRQPSKVKVMGLALADHSIQAPFLLLAWSLVPSAPSAACPSLLIFPLLCPQILQYLGCSDQGRGHHLLDAVVPLKLLLNQQHRRLLLKLTAALPPHLHQVYYHQRIRE